jgi:hypothetical protein
VHAGLGKDIPLDLELEGATKAYWEGERQGHLINNFSEIGWVEPAAESKAGDDEKSLLGASFDNLAYDESKYVLGWPPTMVYLPSAALIRSMVKASIKEERGGDGRPLTVTSSTEILNQFTDVAWLQRRAQEKAEAAALAQGTTAGGDAQLGETVADEAIADALSNAGDGHHDQRQHSKENGDKRRSTKHQKRKQSRS